MNKNLKIALILLDSWLSNIDKTAILDTFEFKSIPKLYQLGAVHKLLVYTARWTSGISEEVYDMGSYRTRRQPSVIRAHIVHFFTYLTSPLAVYSLYHDNYSTRLLVA